MSGEIRFSPAFTVQNVGGDVLVDVDASSADTFPWGKCDFGYRLNYNPPTGSLILIPNPVGFPWVTINSGAVDQIWPPVTDTQYLEPYLRRAKAFVLREGETVIFIRMEGITPFICSGPAVWDPTNSFITVVSRYNNNVDGTNTSVTALTADELLSYKFLYCFTVVASNAEPPVLTVSDNLTVIGRFLDIESGKGGTTLPDGTVDNPHLVWNVGDAEWQIGEIVEPGTAKEPHLIWNTSYSQWQAGLIYEDYAFGFKIGVSFDNVVTVNAGKVRHGTRTPISVASTDITIAAGTNPTWIYVHYHYGSGTATIVGSTTEPVDTEEEHNHALHTWLLYGGVANLVAGGGGIKHLGDIFIPGAFS